MIARRELLIATACVAAAGTAYGIRPRRHVSLLGAEKLEGVIPFAFKAWTSRDVGDLVAPKREGSLVSKLYGETVERVYTQASTGTEIMMLLAYGDTQTNELQLHRPEVCYPAFGFSVSRNQPAILPLGGDVSLPARKLVADAPGRRECVVYWARLGEFLPISGDEQRLDRLKTALGGYIADGLLARFSVIAANPEPAVAALTGFIRSLIRAVPTASRRALIGSRRANALAAAGV